jgi:hypothetical protein
MGSLYQSKSLVNKLFLIKKLYLLRMSDGSSVTEHLNVFNTILIQLSSVDIKIIIIMKTLRVGKHHTIYPIMEGIHSCSLASSRGKPPNELPLQIQYFLTSHYIA